MSETQNTVGFLYQGRRNSNVRMELCTHNVESLARVRTHATIKQEEGVWKVYVFSNAGGGGVTSHRKKAQAMAAACRRTGATSELAREQIAKVEQARKARRAA